MLGNQLKLVGFLETPLFWISNSEVFVMCKNESLNIWNFWSELKIHNVIVSRWKHILIITVFRWPLFSDIKAGNLIIHV